VERDHPDDESESYTDVETTTTREPEENELEVDVSAELAAGISYEVIEDVLRVNAGAAATFPSWAWSRTLIDGPYERETEWERVYDDGEKESGSETVSREAEVIESERTFRLRELAMAVSAGVSWNLTDRLMLDALMGTPGMRFDISEYTVQVVWRP